MILLTIAGNLVLKLGAGVPAADRIIFGVLGWKSLSGLALFGCGGILYAVLLRAVPLNVAQVFIAVQFVAVIITASVLLNEPISPARWLGISVTLLGTFLVVLTARS
jgi:drug/metabolite transporter (DMT)-like permease